MVADVLIYCLSLVCRPGRLEVQIEISLPDENGRIQILQIHTNKMKESSFLAPDVNLQELGTCINGTHIYASHILIHLLHGRIGICLGAIEFHYIIRLDGRWGLELTVNH